MDQPTIPPKPNVVMPPPEAPFMPMATVITPLPQSPKVNKKVLYGILGIVILTITTISGFLLIAKPILYKSNAWNCGAYTFSLSPSGQVTVRNGSAASEPLQRAQLYINNQLINTYDVPALAVGASATLGTVTVPTTTFSWQITGTSDCSNSGRIEKNATSYQCQNIKAYSADGSAQLSGAQLATLSAGTAIRFVAVGTGAATNYTAVRFTINGVLKPESTKKMSSTTDYYDDYTIPTSIKTFAITAELKGTDGNWH